MHSRIVIEGTKFSYGERLMQPVMEVHHAELEPFGTGGFKVHCPICKRGIMLIHRHNESFKLVRRDNCVACGQRFLYLDTQINGQEFHAEP